MASVSSITATIKENVTKKIIAALERGVKPWQRPWVGGDGVRNVASKKPYRGINVALLAIHQMEHDLNSSVYGTFQQFLTAGSPVKKGARGTPIIFWSPVKKNVTEDDGTVKKSQYLLLKTYTVFAVDQTQNPELFAAPAADPTIKPDKEASRVVKATGAKIKHGGAAAFYSPAGDFIQLPPIKSFTSANSYHGTELHELAHWTGHASRCNRTFGKRFGNDEYAVEELVAEMAGCFLLSAVGLPLVELENHASYLKHWINVLKTDSDAILTAASAATKAADYVLAFSRPSADA